MKTRLPLPSATVWKGCLMAISYFLLAACMQYDESLSPSQKNLTAENLEADAAMANATMKTTFTARLASRYEVPTNNLPVISNGQGQAIFKLSKDGTSIHYKLIVANIDNVTQAHIHCGEAGVNGAVVVFLYGFNAAGTTVNGILAEGDITSANIIARADGPNCVGGLQTFDDLVARLQTGRAYVNVHTLQYPAGEIRGQVN